MKQPEKLLGEFKCLNNNKIDIRGTIRVDIQSGSSVAERCPRTTSRHKHNQHNGRRYRKTRPPAIDVPQIN